MALLFAIALLGIGLVAASEVWVTAARRQQAAQMKWVGAQFVSAIGSYYYATPTGAPAYPPSLDDLLDDRRYVTPRRHLRSIYANPYSGKPDWVAMAWSGGGIVGVKGRMVATDGSESTREFMVTPNPAPRSAADGRRSQ